MSPQTQFRLAHHACRAILWRRANDITITADQRIAFDLLLGVGVATPEPTDPPGTLLVLWVRGRAVEAISRRSEIPSLAGRAAAITCRLMRRAPRRRRAHF